MSMNTILWFFKKIGSLIEELKIKGELNVLLLIIYAENISNMKSVFPI